MGIETALAIAGTVATVAGTTVGIVQGAKANKAAKQANKIQQQQPQRIIQQQAPASVLESDPNAEDKKGLNGAQRAALIATSPQGLLDQPTLGRSKLLGN